MNDYHFEPLGLIDYSFLAQETPERHMSVAGVAIFEAGPLRRPGGGIDFAAIRNATAVAIEQIPRYRQKLMWRAHRELGSYLGFGDGAHENESLPPVWVDDPHFDIDYHMRHTALPRPGSDAQLKTLAGRIASQPLDRSRPLWETWVVEGLDGERFALISKLHHCMIDGMSGMDAATILSSTSPDFVPGKPSPWRPRRAPTRQELERELQREQLSAPLRMLRDLLQRDRAELAGEIVHRIKGIGETFAETAGATRTATPLNGRNGPHRAIDWMTVPLQRIKAASKAMECTVNDVVLTILTGALREYLLQTDFAPGSAPFRATVPVSIWGDRRKGEIGNQIAVWMIELPLGKSAPRAQLRAIREVTARLKHSDRPLGVKTLESVLSLAPGLVSLAVRNAAGPSNTLITNIPGPQVALYQMGAKQLAAYPIVPLLEDMGIGIGVMSYNGLTCWGITADRNIVPDVGAFMDALAKSLAAVDKAAGMVAKASPRKLVANKKSAPAKQKTPVKKTAAPNTAPSRKPR
ncbi:MAG TPA: wax ester/triacylglycerol synthase family O-acyltransferase [Pseudomonadales bacterium]|nr:wax ester/triacylglycerol synthase family O-acyltransferase [Pseudomonadales bacterium]